MPLDNPQEPDPAGLMIYIGQDKAGHWLVQDDTGRLEGRFVSQAAAMSFAREEREIYHGRLAMAQVPLVPSVSFVPAGASERVLRRAA